MASAAPKFRMFGIPIRIEPFFVVILLFFGFVMYGPFGPAYIASFTAIAAISVLIHELGHALAFKSYGIQPSIVLHGMGGLTSGRGDISPARNLVITLAGPLPPLLFIGLPAYFVLMSPGHSGELIAAYPFTRDLILQQIVFVNLFWSLLNLIPILPLDGGVVSASLLEMVFKGRGRQIANVVSLGFVVALGLWALSVGEVFLLAMVAMLGFINVQELVRRGGEPEPLAAGPPLVEAHRALLQGQPQLAERLAHEGMVNARDLEQQRWANELLAWARLFSGDVYGAESHVRVMGSSRPPSQALFGALALASGRRDEGTTVLAWSLAREAAGPAKSLAAVAVAHGGATADVVHELRAMGPDGDEGARLLQQLLAYAGYHEQAAIAEAAMTGAPSLAPLPPSPDAPYPAAPTPVAAPPPLPPPPSAPMPPTPPPSAWPSEPPSGPPTGPSPWQAPEAR